MRLRYSLLGPVHGGLDIGPGVTNMLRVGKGDKEGSGGRVRCRWRAEDEEEEREVRMEIGG